MPKGVKVPAISGLAMAESKSIDPYKPLLIDDEGMPTFPGEINGRSIKKNAGSGLKTVLLRAKPGCGKTRFYLTHLLLAVKEAYKNLTHKDLDYEDSENWTPTIRRDVEEASKRCMMCIIDMDYQGVDDLIERDDIVPPELAGAIHIMGVTGFEHESGMRFYEALDIRDKFLKKLDWHNKKYPENRGQRFLVLDNTGELYRETLDKYFYDTSGGEIRSMREKMQQDEAENYKRFKTSAGGSDAPKWKIQGDGGAKVKKAALFQSGRRDTFRVIDADYRGFYRDILKWKPRIGFNFYVTTHVIEYTKEDEKTKVKEEKSFADGRADDLLIGYFNLALTFNKVQNYKKNANNQIVGIELKGYYVDTAIGAKNRLGPDLFMDITNKGAEEFYAEIYRRIKLGSKSSNVQKTEG